MSGSRSATGALRSLPLLGVVLLVFAVGFPPLDDATALDLTVHMLQHVLIIAAGVLIAYPLHRSGRLSAVEGRRSAYLAALATILVLGYWHLPGPWDAAELNPWVHATEHFCFLAVGLFTGSFLLRLSDYQKTWLLLLGFFAQFAYGWLLISSFQVYPLYPVADQGLLGVVMFATGPAYWVGIVYIVLKSQKVIGLGGPSPRLRRLGAAVPVLTIALLVVLASFYGGSLAAIGLAANSQPRTSVVYIVETPVTWDYSPPRISVQIGVNNTVTWISHSISYDTVTGTNGTFSSGPIPPGQTYTHTFTVAGVYEYRCIYHPWMVGYVTVLPPP